MSGTFFERCCKRKNYQQVGDGEFDVEDDRSRPRSVGHQTALRIKVANTGLSVITYGLFIARTAVTDSSAAEVLDIFEKISGALMIVTAGLNTTFDCLVSENTGRRAHAKRALSTTTMMLGVAWGVLYCVEEAAAPGSFGLSVAQFVLGGTDLVSSTLTSVMEYCWN